MIKKQKYFGSTGMLIMLAFISAFPPLSTDMYLPALPQMIVAFDCSQSYVNMTLSLFFVSFAVGILIWGPLSEKYGRKPILLIGLVLYIIFSILCAMAQNVGLLIVFRVLQAFGGGAATAVATAIVKDIYNVRERERVLAIVMALVIIAPVVAPVMGALLLEFASWRAIFWTLSAIAAVAVAASSFLEETHQDRYTGSTLRSLGRLGVVLRNPGFTLLLIIFSLGPISLMAFLAASSYIYIQGFGLTERQFSYFFSFNAICAMAGPLLYVRISKFFSAKDVVTACFGLLIITGLLMYIWGRSSQFLFALIMMPATMSVTTMRPPGANLMLEQQQHDTGAASSLINFFGMVMGSIGMFLVAQEGHDMIATLAVIQLSIGLVGGIMWLVLRNKPFIKQTVIKPKLQKKPIPG